MTRLIDRLENEVDPMKDTEVKVYFTMHVRTTSDRDRASCADSSRILKNGKEIIKKNLFQM